MEVQAVAQGCSYMASTEKVCLKCERKGTETHESSFKVVCQRSPTFLASGTGFVEDNFSTMGVGQWGVVVRVGETGGGAQVVASAKLGSVAPRFTSCSGAHS